MDFLTSMLSGVGDVLKAAMLVCIVWVLVYKPEQVGNGALFRAGIWMFALSLLLPTLANVYFTAASDAPIGRIAAPDPKTAALRIYVGSISPILFFLSVLFITEAIMPRGRKSVP